MGEPIVVKIGGSLIDQLERIIRVLHRSGRPVLIIPGGGKFARLVRDTGADGEHGHWMAVAAMEQMGWYIAAKGVVPVTCLQIPARQEVLLPYTLLRSADPLPHTWDITSDTISAWVASRLGLDLVLLKSVDGIRTGGILQERVNADITTDDVDPCFIRYVLASSVRTSVINGLVPGRVERLLKGAHVPGTTIGF